MVSGYLSARTGHHRETVMLKLMAVIQIVIILLIVTFGTYHLFKGNFELAFGTLPFLFAYYLFFAACQRRSVSIKDNESTDEKS
jgi:hypothetical protein